MTIAPIAPKAFGSIPKNQLGSIFPKKDVDGMNIIPLCWKTYKRVNPIPASIPAIAPSLLIFLEKIPIINAGKIDEAARPNAKATVPAANVKYANVIIAAKD